MEITRTTTVAELIALAAEIPELMKMTLGGLILMANAKTQRNDGLSDQMTLSKFYEEWYLQIISKRNRQSEKTVREINTAMKYWVEYTGDPTLAEINNFTIDKFAAGLYQTKKKNGGTLSDQTVKKHLGAIAGVMAYAGPKNNQYKRATCLMAELPEFPTINKRADVNSRKSALRSKLLARQGTAGSMSIFKDAAINHHEFFLHLTAEKASSLTGKYGTIDVWKLLPNRMNHYWDVLNYATAAGSMVTLSGGTATNNPAVNAQFTRKRVNLTELQKKKNYS
ncbi:MAG: hypothetical protein IJQ39_14235 [Thermoguttaceae bacterium]|nr:hypothetical protein [Thermoguttaceae bacterium]